MRSIPSLFRRRSAKEDDDQLVTNNSSDDIMISQPNTIDQEIELAIVGRTNSNGSSSQRRVSISQVQSTIEESDSTTAATQTNKKWGYPTMLCCKRSSKNRKVNNDDDDPVQQMSPYALLVNEELSPRSSAWLYLSAVSIACLSSLLLTEKAIDDNGGRSVIDLALIILLSISFAVSFIITLGAFRHRGLRNKLTGYIKFMHTSLECIISILLFCTWCIVLRFVSDPSSGLNYGVSMITNEGYEGM